MKITNQQIDENLERCPSFISCNKNLCPIDLELELRAGGDSDKCKWMREGRKRPFSPEGKMLSKEEVKSTPNIEFRNLGGSVMPDELLKYVPKRNAKWLNEKSKKRWHKLKGTKLC